MCSTRLCVCTNPSTYLHPDLHGSIIILPKSFNVQLRSYQCHSGVIRKTDFERMLLLYKYICMAKYTFERENFVEHTVISHIECGRGDGDGDGAVTRMYRAHAMLASICMCAYPPQFLFGVFVYVTGMS